MGNLTIWFTPIWLLSIGVTAGAAILLLLFAIQWLVARPAAESTVRLIKESILLPITYVVAAFVGFCFLAAPMMPCESRSSCCRASSRGENS